MNKKNAFGIASFLGVGYIPFASGTFGSMATLPLALLLIYYTGFWGILISSIIVFIIGTISTKEVLKYTKHDPSLVVIDEVLGQLLTFLFVAPIFQNQISVPILFIGFLLFRFFDITKIQPASFFDKKIENAYGVMLDDLVAGLYAGIVLFFIERMM